MTAVETPPDGLTIEAILADDSTSFALRAVLQAWRKRDPVDAACDASVLLRVLEAAADRRLAALS